MNNANDVKKPGDDPGFTGTPADEFVAPGAGSAAGEEFKISPKAVAQPAEDAQTVPAPAAETKPTEEPVKVVVAPVEEFVHLRIPCSTIEKVNSVGTNNANLNEKDIDVKGTVSFQVYETNDGPTINAASQKIMEKVLNVTGINVKVEQLKKTNTWGCGTMVNGDQAINAFTAKTKGVYKLYLYNTGIYIILRPLDIGTMNRIFESIDFKSEQLGRSIGEYQYLVYDALFKDAIVESLLDFVIGSNLKKWNVGKTLAKSISINDYDAIVWALSAMVTSRKLTVGCECFDCNHGFIRELDFGKFHLLINMSAAAIERIHADKEEVTANDILEYQEKLLNNHKSIMYSGNRISLREPSLDMFVSNCKAIIAAIAAKIADEPTMRNASAINELLTRYNSNYTPWIWSISNIDAEGKVVFTTQDPKAFPEILNMCGLGDTHKELYDKMEDYIYGTRVNCIGYTPIACEKCGAIPETKSGYVAWDPNRIFFEITYQTLEKEGLLLGVSKPTA